jgi:hypothetical protein
MSDSPARMPYADQCPRAYTRTGKTAHLLPPLASLNTHGSALCGVLPEWFEAWRGSGSQLETEILASLPLCRRCEKHAQRADEADARIAALGRQERAS